MRWQTVLRIGIALAGIGVAVLVYLNLRERPVDTTAMTEAPLSEPDVLSEYVAGDKPATFEFLGPDGKPAMVIAFQRSKVFVDGRKEFDDINATFLRAGVKNTIVAKRAVATGKAGPTGDQPAEVVFTGDVRLTSEDGISVQAKDEATFYNIEQKTVIPGAMTFTRGRLSGSGVGADLYMDRSVLWINTNARLKVAPETGGGSPIDAQANKIGLADADHYMVLEGDAVMNHHSQRLSANNARVSFSDVGDVVQFIELRERSKVVSTGSGASRPNLTAENINLTFAPDTGLLTHTKLVQGAVVELKDSTGLTRVSGTDIDIFVGADGETLTKLEATAPVRVSLPQQGGQPAKVITSSGLVADGDDTRGLTRAEFSGGVKYTETRAAGRGQPALSREATSQTLVLGLKGDLAQVESAVFTQNFRVKDGELTATAHEGTYDSVKETLRLRNPAGVAAARPKAINAELEVVANEIDADLKTDGFHARGRVDSFLTPSSKTQTKSSGGLFEAGKRISGASDSLTYRRDAGTAVYEGAVFLVQEDSTLRGDRVDIDDVKGDLVAKGNVSSKLTLQPEKPGAPKQKPAIITAGQLVYSDSARTAVYTGSAALETSTGEHLRGEQITLTLEPRDRKLKTAEAVAAPGGEVRVALPEGKQAVGVRAIYTAATDAYQVHGQLAAFIVPAPEKGPGECSIGNGTVLEFSRTDGAAQVRTDGGALGRMKPAKCADVIKVIK